MRTAHGDIPSVTGTPSAGSRPRASRRKAVDTAAGDHPPRPSRSPLVGRDVELRALERFLARVRTAGDVLALSGDLGIGKSALLQDVVRAARHDGITVVEIRGYKAEADLTGAGLMQVLLHLAALTEKAPGPSGNGENFLAGLTAADGPRRAGTAVATALAEVCAAGSPVLLTLDDAQWFDKTSLEALFLALRHLAGTPAGLLLAGRPAPECRPGPLPSMPLGPLDRDSGELLLRRHGRSLPPSLFERVLREAEGNPAGIIGIARTLESSEAPAAAVLAPRLPLGDRLREKVATLLEGVPTAAQDFLLLAAEAATDRTDLLCEAALFAGMASDGPAAAEACGLVTLQGARLRFRHPLLRSALHWGSSFAHRRRANLALAEFLTEDPYQRALHLAAAAAGPEEATAAALEAGVEDDLPQAAAVLELSADLSPRPQDRARRLVQAARAAEARGEGAELKRLVGRLTAAPVDASLSASVGALEARVAYHSDGVPAHALDLLVRSASAPVVRWPPAFLPLTGAIAPVLCEPSWNRLLRPRLEALAAEEPLRERCPFLMSALCWTDRTVYASPARGLLEEAEGALREDGFPRDPTRDAALVIAATALDESAAADRLGTHVLRELVALGHFGTARTVLAHLQTAHLHLGDRSSVLRDADQGERWARSAGDTHAAMVFRAGVAQVEAWEGDEDGHRSLTDGILSFALPRRLHMLAARARWARGLMALGHGRPEEAYEELRMLSDADGDARHPVAAAWALGDLVAAAVASGRDDDVRAYVGHLHRLNQRVRSGLLAHLLARSEAVLSDGADAEQHFVRALTGRGCTAGRYERARTRLAFGEWLRRQRRVLEARGHLQQARETFDALGADVWSRRADSELLAAGETPHSPHPPWAEEFGLTPREAEVARLAAAGLSNQAIGWQLGLTHRTVASHLSRVFAKAGVGSRKQLPSVLRG